MKQVFTLLFTLSLVSSVLAQTITHWQPYIRAGAGGSRAIGEAINPSVQTIFGGDTEIPPHLGGQHWLTAVNAGVGFVKPLANQFYLQVEANAELKGSSMNLNEEVNYGLCGIVSCSSIPVYGSFSSRVLYLTVPVLVGYRVGKVALAVGPYFGIKAGEWQQGHYTYGGSSDASQINSFGRHYKAVDAGFSSGLTYELTQLIGVEFRYSQGLLSFAKPYGRDHEQSYNQTAQVGVRYNLLR